MFFSLTFKNSGRNQSRAGIAFLGVEDPEVYVPSQKNKQAENKTTRNLFLMKKGRLDFVGQLEVFATGG